MRILIKLRCVESSLFETQYHHHLQAFIYDLLRDSKYDYMHNKQGYKFFCFSNIFPVTKNLEKNDLRNLIISSPNGDFISFLNEKLHSNNKQIMIGKMKFRVDSCRKINVVIPTDRQYSLITGTPIIVRIRRDKYDNYNDDIEQIKSVIYLSLSSLSSFGLLTFAFETNFDHQCILFVSSLCLWKWCW